MTNLIFPYSPWWLLVVLAVAGLYAGALYRPWRGEGFFGRSATWALAALRFAVVTLLGLLLLNPLVRSVQTFTEPPRVVLAIDNSQSVGGARGARNTLAQLETLRSELTRAGVAVSVRTLTDTGRSELSSTQFTARRTDLSALLGGLRTDYEGRHLTDVILVSDGIVNAGVTPTVGQYPFRVQAVGLGDTVPQRDVQLRALLTERIANLGVPLTVRAEVASAGFAGQSATVVLRQDGREVARQSVRFARNETFATLTFSVKAEPKGLRRFTAEVLPLPGEFSRKNNAQDVYVDVIDGKQRILILALAPHPDVKALRAILQKNPNYQVEVQTITGGEGVAATADRSSGKPYDLLILHQLPDQNGLGNATVQRLINVAPAPALFFVYGAATSQTTTNAINPVLNVSAGPGQVDRVMAVASDGLGPLGITADRLTLLPKLPPLTVPLGTYQLQPGSEVILTQQSSNGRDLNRPLLAMNLTGGRKAATLVGEGLWQWRLEEFAQTDRQDVVDDLIQRVVQRLTVKEDRRKLRVYPLRDVADADEPVVFETEQYNDLYERIYNQPVQLRLTDERGRATQYNYTPTEGNSTFEISRLPEGVYTYRATATLNERSEEATGRFIVRDEQLETRTTTADFALLRQLAQQTGGQFYRADNVANLVKTLTDQRPPGKLTSSEQLAELLNWRWLLALAILLAGAEWGLRKYFGGY